MPGDICPDKCWFAVLCRFRFRYSRGLRRVVILVNCPRLLIWYQPSVLSCLFITFYFTTLPVSRPTKRGMAEWFVNDRVNTTYKYATSRVLFLEHVLLWCWNLDTSESRSEISGTFLNAMLEKDGDQMDRSCEKWSITQGQGNKYPTHKKKNEG